MRDFKKLAVWEKAHAFTLLVYRVTDGFPEREKYGLVRQIRRSAASVPANIAEGYARRADTELAQFLNIALGSAAETEYHLILARDLGYVNEEDIDALESAVDEIQRVLVSLQSKVRSDPPRPV